MTQMLIQSQDQPWRVPEFIGGNPRTNVIQLVTSLESHVTFSTFLEAPSFIRFSNALNNFLKLFRK